MRKTTAFSFVTSVLELMDVTLVFVGVSIEVRMLPQRWMPYTEATLIGAALALAAFAYVISRLAGD
jgi:hypothetical protein